MKNTSLCRAAILSAVLAVGVASSSRAATKYWDIDGANPGAGGGASPTGTWDTGTTSNWSTSSDGDVATTTWTAGDDAVFSAGSTATGGFIVTIGAADTVVAKSVTMNTGSLLLGPGTLSFGASLGTFNINTGSTFNVSGTGSGFIAGTGGIVKTGSGTLDLGGSEQYSSASGAQLTVSGGTVNFSGDTALGLVPGAFRAGAVTLDGGALNFTGSSTVTTNAFRGLSITANGGTINIVNNVTLSINGNPGIAGPSNSTFTRSGTGTFTPASAGAFSGKWVFLGGLQSIAGDSRFGSTAPSSPVADSITLSNASIRTTTVGGLIINANRGITLGSGGGTFLLNTAVTGGMTYNGIIAGTSGGAFTIQGESDAVFASLGGANTYNGSTLLRRGTLNVTATNVLPQGSTLTIGSTSSLGTFNIGGFNQTVGGLNTAGTAANQRITNSGSADATLTINNDTSTTNADFTFGGVITDGATNKTGLRKTGSRSLALSATNTYSGPTTIVNGTLSLSGAATIGSGTLNLSGGRLSASASRSVATPNPINVTANSAITTTTTAATPQFELSSNLVGGDGTSVLTFRNDGADQNTDNFQPRFSGSGFNFANPVDIENGAVGQTTLHSYNTTGTTQTFSGIISGNGGYTRNASVAGTGGQTVFTNANTYSGGTIVSRGLLTVNNASGSGTGTGSVTVNSDGTLAGTGIVSGAITSSGKIAPGDGGVGTLKTGDVTLSTAGAALVADIDVSNTPAADLLDVTGAVSLTGSTLNITLANAPAPDDSFVAQTYIVVNNDGADAVSGTFNTILVSVPGYGALVDTAYTGTDALGRIGDGNEIAVTVSTPEPAAFGCLLLGGLSLLGRRRRRSKIA